MFKIRVPAKASKEATTGGSLRSKISMKTAKTTAPRISSRAKYTFILFLTTLLRMIAHLQLQQLFAKSVLFSC